jgi:hypothetical protein
VQTIQGSAPTLLANPSFAVDQTPQLKLTVPTPNYDATINNANAAVAGASSAVKSYEDLYKLYNPPPTPEQQKADQYSLDLEKLLEQTAGMAAEKKQQETDLGVPKMGQELATLNADILRKVEEYNILDKSYEAARQALHGSPQQLASVVGTKEQELLRTQSADLNQKSADIKLLQALALGKQGQIDAARQTAQDAVDLKYAPILEKIDTKQKQLDILVKSGVLTRQETARAAALQTFNQQEQERVKEEKTKAKNNLSLALSLGISNRFIRQPNGEIFDNSNGISFTSLEDFQTKTGMTLNEAYSKGMVAEISAQTLADNKAINELKTKYWDAGLTGRETLDEAATKINANSRIRAKELKSGGGTVTERLLADQQTIVSNAVSQLNNERSTSSDGYANPDTYRRFKQQYIAADGTPTNFFQSFPLEVYISPPNRKGDLLGTSEEIKQTEKTTEQNELQQLLQKSNNGQNIENLNLQEKMKLLEALGG